MKKESDFFNLNISNITYRDCVENIVSRAKQYQSSYLCTVNVHMLVLSQKDTQLRQAINKATWAVTDGVPVTWTYSLFKKRQERIAGMDLTPKLLEEANKNFLTVSVYGNTELNLALFKAYIRRNYENIKIGEFISPPFRNLSTEEQTLFINKINKKKSQIIFVSLGCPKQEKWMLNYSHKINGVCLGIGNAINTTIGEEKRPALIFQKMGLEWVFRLLQDPRRLFKRYAITNTKFIIMILKKVVYG